MRIGDYSFLSDCQSAALVSRRGSVDWFCVPRFDSPPVFSGLLDPHAGHWHIRPRGGFSQSRSYLKDTLVVENVFETGSGSVKVTDALALHAEKRGHEIGEGAPHVLLRMVEGVSGHVDMEMEFRPRFEYGLTLPWLQEQEGGVSALGGPVRLDLTASVPIWIVGETAGAGFTVKAGETAWFGLAYAETYAGTAPARVRVADSLKHTVAAWRSWAGLHEVYQGLHEQEVRTGALVLQGLTYQPSGAIVAAATTSLPEVMGGEANWDYRYAWLRDISLMMSALWVAACPDEPDRFFEWISHTGVGRSDAVQIMFGVEGERDLSERQLDNLVGFAGSRPVRVGNQAWRQRQLDVFGEVIYAAYLLRERLSPMEEMVRKLLIGLAERASRQWQLPDAGMWEARDRMRHYTSSKVMCWTGLDCAIKMSAMLRVGKAQKDRWRRARDRIKKAVLKQAWNSELGAFAGAFGSDRLDASVLQMPLMGFLPASDERMQSTIRLISQELYSNGVVRRWQEEENGFIACNYWLVECLAMVGELDGARELFETTTALSNDLGLMSEEADAATGELLGNFPQAFAHVGLINASWRLTQLEERGAD